MDDLVQWLGARLDDEERVARAAASLSGGVPRAGEQWRVSGSHADDGGTYWSITTVSPDLDRIPPIEMVGSGMSGGGAHTEEVAAHIASHDPARVLRDIDAKRELLKVHAASDMGTWVLGDGDDEPACRTCGDLTTRFPCRTVKLLAAVYSDRPGYLDSWRP